MTPCVARPPALIAQGSRTHPSVPLRARKRASRWAQSRHLQGTTRSRPARPSGRYRSSATSRSALRRPDKSPALRLQGLRRWGAARVGQQPWTCLRGVTRAGQRPSSYPSGYPSTVERTCGGARPGPAGDLGAWALLTTPNTPLQAGWCRGWSASPRSWDVRRARGEVVERRTEKEVEDRRQESEQGSREGFGVQELRVGRRRWTSVEERRDRAVLVWIDRFQYVSSEVVGAGSGSMSVRCESGLAAGWGGVRGGRRAGGRSGR